MSDCIFCKIVEGKEKSYTIYEDEKVKAVLDVFPVNEGHVLVIYKKHVENMFKLDEEDFLHMFRVARKISLALMKALNAENVNILISESVIKHAFLHVIPRYDYDLMGLIPDLDNKRPMPAEELERIQEKIKGALK